MNKSKKSNELEQLIKEKEEYLQGWKRALADLENYKKQLEREKDVVVKLLKADIILKIIPVVANFDKAVLSVPADQKDSDWVKGILAIKSQLEDFLKQEGVEKVKTVGEKFDPCFCEAMLEEEYDGEDGIILEELESGYKVGDRVIKYPKVKVSKKKI